VAVGAINAAHNMGVKIPEEMSIVGFDDTDMRGLVYPMMTAVCQDSKRLGQAAFERVVRLARGGDVVVDDDSTAQHAAWLEINETTGPPPESPSHVLPNRTRLPVKKASA
jgi:DNA-binding LacI/PurR family transcriptional regulator